jgi:hypothetical protein
MATAALCGSTGSITNASGTEVTEWEVTVAVDTIGGTSMASAGWVEKLACLKGASGTFSCIGTAPTIGLHASCAFLNSTAGYHINGDIRISDVKRSTPVKDRIIFVATFVFTGPVVCATLL